jgi:hypothetical protein
VTRAARLLRSGLTVALVALASGAANVVLAAMHDDDCATACDGDAGPRHCPPNCQQGACAKIQPSTAAGPVIAPSPTLPGVTQEATALVASPHLPMFTSGIFHPPRA